MQKSLAPLPAGVADYRQSLTEFERRVGIIPIIRPTERYAMEIHADGVVTVYDNQINWVARTFAGPDAVYSATGFMIKEEY